MQQQVSSPTQTRQQAIAAAKRGDWTSAVTYNQQLLEIDPADTQALNRLGVAYLQLSDRAAAKQSFKNVLEIDKTNSIAKKNLIRLESNPKPTAPSFTNHYFIEEPGKTKTVELHRLAGKQALDQLSVGLPCELKLKNRFISIENNGQYIGALPEDLSFRLGKLINRGNEYSCVVRSCSNNSCTVYLKETLRSKKNHDIHSFPPAKHAQNSLSDVDDRFLIDEDIPIEIVDTDQDFERSFDDLETDSSIEE